MCPWTVRIASFYMHLAWILSLAFGALQKQAVQKHFPKIQIFIYVDTCVIIHKIITRRKEAFANFIGKRTCPMDYEPSYKEFSTIFKALSDETRLCIVDMLSCAELSACDILRNFTLSQSTLSYHMKILIEAHIVNARREGLWTKYSINDETFQKVMDFLPDLYKMKNECVCKQIKYCKEGDVCEVNKNGKDSFGF